MGTAPLNPYPQQPPPPRTSSAGWLLWLVGGCLLIVIVVVAGVVGFLWWGKTKLTNIVEDQRDPVKREMRAKEMLGASALPPGYHAGMSINVGLAGTTSLSDMPMSGEDMQYDERGFIFNDSIRAGEPKAERFARNEGGNSLDDSGVRLRSDEVLDGGTLEVNNQKLTWSARRGEVTHSGQAIPGQYSIILIRCSDDRERWAVWFQKMPSENPAPVTEAAGIRDFFSNFHICH